MADSLCSATTTDCEADFRFEMDCDVAPVQALRSLGGSGVGEGCLFLASVGDHQSFLVFCARVFQWEVAVVLAVQHPLPPASIASVEV